MKKKSKKSKKGGKWGKSCQKCVKYLGIFFAFLARRGKWGDIFVNIPPNTKKGGIFFENFQIIGFTWEIFFFFFSHFFFFFPLNMTFIYPCFTILFSTPSLAKLPSFNPIGHGLVELLRVKRVKNTKKQGKKGQKKKKNQLFSKVPDK